MSFIVYVSTTLTYTMKLIYLMGGALRVQVQFTIPHRDYLYTMFAAGRSFCRGFGVSHVAGWRIAGGAAQAVADSCSQSIFSSLANPVHNSVFSILNRGVKMKTKKAAAKRFIRNGSGKLIVTSTKHEHLPRNILYSPL